MEPNTLACRSGTLVIDGIYGRIKKRGSGSSPIYDFDVFRTRLKKGIEVDLLRGFGHSRPDWKKVWILIDLRRSSI